jgi:hypothetical protein
MAARGRTKSTASSPEHGLVEDSYPAPTVVVDVWLRRSAPDPTRWRRGTVALGPGRAHWRPRHRSAEPGARAIDLERADLTRARGTTAREVLRLDRAAQLPSVRWRLSRSAAYPTTSSLPDWPTG